MAGWRASPAVVNWNSKHAEPAVATSALPRRSPARVTVMNLRWKKNGDPIGRPEIPDGNAGEFHGSPSGLPAMPALRLKVREMDQAGREAPADPVTVSVGKRQR